MTAATLVDLVAVALVVDADGFSVCCAGAACFKGCGGCFVGGPAEQITKESAAIGEISGVLHHGLCDHHRGVLR